MRRSGGRAQAANGRFNRIEERMPDSLLQLTPLPLNFI